MPPTLPAVKDKEERLDEAREEGDETKIDMALTEYRTAVRDLAASVFDLTAMPDTKLPLITNRMGEAIQLRPVAAHPTAGYGPDGARLALECTPQSPRTAELDCRVIDPTGKVFQIRRPATTSPLTGNPFYAAWFPFDFPEAPLVLDPGRYEVEWRDPIAEWLGVSTTVLAESSFSLGVRSRPSRSPGEREGRAGEPGP